MDEAPRVISRDEALRILRQQPQQTATPQQQPQPPQQHRQQAALQQPAQRQAMVQQRAPSPQQQRGLPHHWQAVPQQHQKSQPPHMVSTAVVPPASLPSWIKAAIPAPMPPVQLPPGVRPQTTLRRGRPPLHQQQQQLQAMQQMAPQWRQRLQQPYANPPRQPLRQQQRQLQQQYSQQQPGQQRMQQQARVQQVQQQNYGVRQQFQHRAGHSLADADNYQNNTAYELGARKQTVAGGSMSSTARSFHKPRQSESSGAAQTLTLQQAMALARQQEAAETSPAEEPFTMDEDSTGVGWMGGNADGEGPSFVEPSYVEPAYTEPEYHEPTMEGRLSGTQDDEGDEDYVPDESEKEEYSGDEEEAMTRSPEPPPMPRLPPGIRIEPSAPMQAKASAASEERVAVAAGVRLPKGITTTLSDLPGADCARREPKLAEIKTPMSIRPHFDPRSGEADSTHSGTDISNGAGFRTGNFSQWDARPVQEDNTDRAQGGESVGTNPVSQLCPMTAPAGGAEPGRQLPPNVTVNKARGVDGLATRNTDSGTHRTPRENSTARGEHDEPTGTVVKQEPFDEDSEMYAEGEGFYGEERYAGKDSYDDATEYGDDYHEEQDGRHLRPRANPLEPLPSEGAADGAVAPATVAPAQPRSLSLQEAMRMCKQPPAPLPEPPKPPQPATLSLKEAMALCKQQTAEEQAPPRPVAPTTLSLKEAMALTKQQSKEAPPPTPPANAQLKDDVASNRQEAQKSLQPNVPANVGFREALAASEQQKELPLRTSQPANISVSEAIALSKQQGEVRAKPVAPTSLSLKEAMALCKQQEKEAATPEALKQEHDEEGDDAVPEEDEDALLQDDSYMDDEDALDDGALDEGTWGEDDALNDDQHPYFSEENMSAIPNQANAIDQYRHKLSNATMVDSRAYASCEPNAPGFKSNKGFGELAGPGSRRDDQEKWKAGGMNRTNYHEPASSEDTFDHEEFEARDSTPESSLPLKLPGGICASPAGSPPKLPSGINATPSPADHSMRQTRAGISAAPAAPVPPAAPLPAGIQATPVPAEPVMPRLPPGIRATAMPAEVPAQLPAGIRATPVPPEPLPPGLPVGTRAVPASPVPGQEGNRPSSGADPAMLIEEQLPEEEEYEKESSDDYDENDDDGGMVESEEEYDTVEASSGGLTSTVRRQGQTGPSPEAEPSVPRQLSLQQAMAMSRSAPQPAPAPVPAATPSSEPRRLTVQEALAMSRSAQAAPAEPSEPRRVSVQEALAMSRSAPGSAAELSEPRQMSVQEALAMSRSAPAAPAELSEPRQMSVQEALSMSRSTSNTSAELSEPRQMSVQEAVAMSRSAPAVPAELSEPRQMSVQEALAMSRSAPAAPAELSEPRQMSVQEALSMSRSTSNTSAELSEPRQMSVQEAVAMSRSAPAVPAELSEPRQMSVQEALAMSRSAPAAPAELSEPRQMSVQEALSMSRSTSDTSAELSEPRQMSVQEAVAMARSTASAPSPSPPVAAQPRSLSMKEALALARSATPPTQSPQPVPSAEPRQLSLQEAMAMSRAAPPEEPPKMTEKSEPRRLTIQEAIAMFKGKSGTLTPGTGTHTEERENTEESGPMSDQTDEVVSPARPDRSSEEGSMSEPGALQAEGVVSDSEALEEERGASESGAAEDGEQMEDEEAPGTTEPSDVAALETGMSEDDPIDPREDIPGTDAELPNRDALAARVKTRGSKRSGPRTAEAEISPDQSAVCDDRVKQEISGIKVEGIGTVQNDVAKPKYEPYKIENGFKLDNSIEESETLAGTPTQIVERGPEEEPENGAVPTEAGDTDSRPQPGLDSESTSRDVNAESEISRDDNPEGESNATSADCETGIGGAIVDGALDDSIKAEISSLISGAVLDADQLMQGEVDGTAEDLSEVKDMLSMLEEKPDLLGATEGEGEESGSEGVGDEDAESGSESAESGEAKERTDEASDAGHEGGDDNEGPSNADKPRRRKKKSRKRKRKRTGEGDADSKDDEESGPLNKRRNIRQIMTEEKLDAETLRAQEEEKERQQRLLEQKRWYEQFKKEQERVAAEKAAENAEAQRKAAADVIVLSSDEEKHETKASVDQDIKPKVEPVAAAAPGETSDDDIQLLSSDEADKDEGPAEDSNNSGSHTDDTCNVPDSMGRVLVNVGHPPSETDIFIAPQIARNIKPHQIGGVRFLYDNLIESLERCKTTPGFGCILAHSMGLGKTMQTVTFSDIFLRHTGHRTVLIIVPINTIQNWLNEFNFWLPAAGAYSPLAEGGEIRPRHFAVSMVNDSHRSLHARTKVIQDWYKEGGVLLIGYELYRLLSISSARNTRRKKRKDGSDDLEAEAREKSMLEGIKVAITRPGPDLVICDEGHRIKNAGASISQALKSIRTRRRLALTGYPLQNCLVEYWCMVDFVRPNFLGTKAEFNNMFERPISNGQCVDSTASDVRLMRFRSHVLHSLLEGLVQRRSHAILQATLPKKEEYVCLLRMTALQRRLYRSYMLDLTSRSGHTPNPLRAFVVSCKIWNHPDILYNLVKKKMADEDLDLDEPHDGVSPAAARARRAAAAAASGAGAAGAGAPQPGPHSQLPLDANPFERPAGENNVISYDWAQDLLQSYVPGQLENSTKMMVFALILEETVKLRDKMLVFSQSLFTLNIIEEFLQQNVVPNTNQKWMLNQTYFRLDGSTTGLEREKLINEFNVSADVPLFLVSTRAGSLGVNLVGANRVLVFDASWNPCHDTQAVCRVYRFGQLKKCYIYRLVTDNCLERRIYDRQLKKQSMSNRIVDETNPDNMVATTSLNRLLDPNEDDPPPAEVKLDPDKHEDPVLTKVVQKLGHLFSQEPFEHDAQLADRTDKRLTQAEKRLAKRSYELEKKAANTGGRPGAAGLYPRGMPPMYGRMGMYNKPVANVRPMMMGGRMMQRGGAQFTNSRLSSEQLTRQGVSMSHITVPKDVTIPTGSGDGEPIYLRAGQTVLVIRTAKGVYLRLQDGRIIAIRMPPGSEGRSGLDMLSGGRYSARPPPPPPPSAGSRAGPSGIRLPRGITVERVPASGQPPPPPPSGPRGPANSAQRRAAAAAGRAASVSRSVPRPDADADGGLSISSLLARRPGSQATGTEQHGSPPEPGGDGSGRTSGEGAAGSAAAHLDWPLSEQPGEAGPAPPGGTAEEDAGSAAAPDERDRSDPLARLQNMTVTASGESEGGKAGSSQPPQDSAQQLDDILQHSQTVAEQRGQQHQQQQYQQMQYEQQMQQPGEQMHHQQMQQQQYEQYQHQKQESMAGGDIADQQRSEDRFDPQPHDQQFKAEEGEMQRPPTVAEQLQRQLPRQPTEPEPLPPPAGAMDLARHGPQLAHAGADLSQPMDLAVGTESALSRMVAQPHDLSSHGMAYGARPRYPPQYAPPPPPGRPRPGEPPQSQPHHQQQQQHHQPPHPQSQQHHPQQPHLQQHHQQPPQTHQQPQQRQRHRKHQQRTHQQQQQQQQQQHHQQPVSHGGGLSDLISGFDMSRGLNYSMPPVSSAPLPSFSSVGAPLPSFSSMSQLPLPPFPGVAAAPDGYPVTTSGAPTADQMSREAAQMSMARDSGQTPRGAGQEVALSRDAGMLLRGPTPLTVPGSEASLSTGVTSMPQPSVQLQMPPPRDLAHPPMPGGDATPLSMVRDPAPVPMDTAAAPSRLAEEPFPWELGGSQYGYPAGYPAFSAAPGYSQPPVPSYAPAAPGYPPPLGGYSGLYGAPGGYGPYGRYPPGYQGFGGAPPPPVPFSSGFGLPQPRYEPYGAEATPPADFSLPLPGSAEDSAYRRPQ